MILAYTQVPELVSIVSRVHGYITPHAFIPGLFVDTPAAQDQVDSLCRLYCLLGHFFQDRDQRLASAYSAVVEIITSVATQLFFVESSRN